MASSFWKKVARIKAKVISNTHQPSWRLISNASFSTEALKGWKGQGKPSTVKKVSVVSIDVRYYPLDYSLVFSAIAHRRNPILNGTFHVLLHTHIMHSFGLYAIFGTHIDIIRTEHRIVFTLNHVCKAVGPFFKCIVKVMLLSSFLTCLVRPSN